MEVGTSLAQPATRNAARKVGQTAQTDEGKANEIHKQKKEGRTVGDQFTVSNRCGNIARVSLSAISCPPFLDHMWYKTDRNRNKFYYGWKHIMYLNAMS